MARDGHQPNPTVSTDVPGRWLRAAAPATALLALACAIPSLAPAADAAPFPARPTTQPPALLALTLAPRAAAGSDAVDSITVTLRFAGAPLPAGAALLDMPLVSSNVDSVATTLTGLSASDARGSLHLSFRDVTAALRAARDAETGGPAREWIADRPVEGALTVRYTIPANATLPPRGPAPPFAFSNDGDGMSAAGHVFLMLPPADARYRTTIDWDLSGLPAGARGISSFGEGRVTAPEPLSAAQLRMSFYMAGRIGSFPARLPPTGFFGAWQGKPAFDAAALLGWTSRLYGHYATFFGQRTPPPYGVFLRYNPINAGGGVGLHHAFVTTFGKGDGSNVDKMRITLAHEMFHTFQPYIEQPAGLESSWFGEGLATFYASRLALRYGQITPQAFIDDVNDHAGRYYTSLMATVPNGEVPKRFWADTRVRTLPYDRGMLYFATIDEALRARSGGRLTLDTLMLAMLAKEKAGAPLTNADWEAELTRTLGARAVDEFRAFLSGRMPEPSSAAFGPCFRRVARPLRRYEVGFDPAVLAEPKRIIRGLVAGSAAAKAGLRDGDEIVVPVPQDGIQGNQTQMLDLSIRRDGRIFPITYLPRGETVDAWQWERRTDVPGRRCAL